MRVIDFRARPNTPEYMGMYPSSRSWDLYFNYPKPPTVSLADFIGELDRVGVGQALFTGRQTPVLTLSNDYVADCVKAYPNRLFGFAGINPTKKLAALREIERAVTELGLKGISIDPHSSKIFPDDKLFYPLYYKCLELDIPVAMTMGPVVGRWGGPAAVDLVAEDLPDLKIVLSHGVWPQVTEFIALAYRHENVYLEASIYQFLPGGEPLFEAANTILQDKIVYASAFPFRPIDDLHRFLKHPFDKAVVDKLVYRNAARLLKIEASA